MSFSGGGGSGAAAIAIISIDYTNKGIIEDFDTDYGRMNAMLGVEIGQRVNLTPLMQTSIPYYDIDPPTEIYSDSNPAVIVGSLSDGTQIWKVTHNGVDTHAIHVHNFNWQVINRVAWDGTVEPPDPNEVGWKDTVRMNPLEDAYVALRPIKPPVPFGVPNSIRPLDPTAPVGVAAPPQFHNADPMNMPATVVNHMVNYGWEFLFHCHLLGHEENIMMRPMIFAVTPNAPLSVTVLSTGTIAAPRVTVSWIDNSTDETNWTINRATSLAGPWTTVARGTTYYYQVMATNIVGDTTVYAAPAVSYPNLATNSAPATSGKVTTLAFGGLPKPP